MTGFWTVPGPRSGPSNDGTNTWAGTGTWTGRARGWRSDQDGAGGNGWESRGWPRQCGAKSSQNIVKPREPVGHCLHSTPLGLKWTVRAGRTRRLTPLSHYPDVTAALCRHRAFPLSCSACPVGFFYPGVPSPLYFIPLFCRFMLSRCPAVRYTAALPLYPISRCHAAVPLLRFHTFLFFRPAGSFCPFAPL